ncbi:MAG: Crp/Fnr family transcriptional regulator [Haliscomenobacter sp.]|uniref:Crp/Fnr family transcriptional regulator n=1 Tax=Haliscomenobacter sp. TaxID=2717303 RepID=UPI0029A5484A|nr:Crp/Fnr family transcriptional regulator [Haliscomenobacter sp.]MDX2068630.1 Crp/Fnr family transcriptional regulator [Haliscomenobacter sp.]
MNIVLPSDYFNKGKEVEYPKNFILQKEGKMATKFWALKKGIARYIYTQNDKEYSGWFDFENEIVGSINSLVNLGIANETIQLIEDSELIEFTISDFDVKDEKFIHFKTQIIQYYFIELEKRVKFFQSLDAKQRYQYLLQHKPQFIKRIPQHLLASFLGITPESLSRIRTSVS